MSVLFVNVVDDIGERYILLILSTSAMIKDLGLSSVILSTIHGIQTIITCTGIEVLSDYLDDNAKIF
ncbi:DNA replication and repair protein RecF, partial [human gut metagenome]